MKYIEEFRSHGELVAVLIKREFQNRRTARHATFVSNNDQSLQVGVGHYPSDLLAPRHTHDKVRTEAQYEELLHLVRGRMRVDLYGTDRIKFASLVMRAGDTIHLVSGGHGFKMLTPCKCIEIKQGPYRGVYNKTNF